MLTKVHIVKAMVFSSSHVRACELNCKEGRAPKKWCFQTVVLEKALESPLDCKEIKPVNSKRNQLWIVIGRTDAEAEVPIFWPPDVKYCSIGKTLMLGKTVGKRRRGWQRAKWLDSITDSMDMNLSKLRETVKDKEVWLPQSMWSQSWTWLSKWTHTLI